MNCTSCGTNASGATFVCVAGFGFCRACLRGVALGMSPRRCGSLVLAFDSARRQVVVSDLGSRQVTRVSEHRFMRGAA